MNKEQYYDYFIDKGYEWKKTFYCTKKALKWCLEFEKSSVNLSRNGHVLFGMVNKQKERRLVMDLKEKTFLSGKGFVRKRMKNFKVDKEALEWKLNGDSDDDNNQRGTVQSFLLFGLENKQKE